MSQNNKSIDCKCDLKYTQLSVVDNNLLSKINFVIIHSDDYGTENIIITTSDEVFGFGTNNHGRLGFGTRTEVNTPKVIPELSAKKVKIVRFGVYSSVALTESGDVYTFGYEKNGALGNGRNSCTYTKPEKIKLNQLIIDIKCCKTRTILLTKTNQIYWFGYRQNDFCISNPTLLDNFNNEKVIQISSGSDHFLVLTKTGNSYSWGGNSYGELGVGHNNISDTPQQIQIPNESVKRISCGNKHSLILTTNGVIYSFGYNGFGQLGTGNTSTERSPKVVTEVTEKFIDIYAFDYISMALTENQTIYVWGQSKENDNILTPLKTDLNSFKEVIVFHCRKIYNYKPLTPTDIFIKRPLNRVMQTTTKMFNNPKYSDLKFKIIIKESEKFDYIYGHKSFIENSEYFKTMFAQKWAENQTNEIQISNYSYEAYYQYIKCLYTDYIETENIEELTELLSITEEYLDGNTKLKCVEKIKPLTTLLNVCTIYSCALKYRSNELEDYCFEMMSNNIKFISKTEGYNRMDGNDVKHFSTKHFQK